MRLKVTCLYEVAYYTMNGAVIEKIEVKHFKSKKGKGFDTACVVTVDGVHPKYRKQWKQHKAVGDLRKFSYERQRIKKKIKRKRYRPLSEV